MGAAFAPNHKGMPLVAKDTKLDFFSRQVLTSRNIKGSWLKDNLMGGLNYQVEHHLFPSICHVHYPAIAAIVKQTAAEHGVPYLQNESFAKAFKLHLVTLRRFGHVVDLDEAIV
mgnify:CR=1 FL=1